LSQVTVYRTGGTPRRSGVPTLAASLVVSALLAMPSPAALAKTAPRASTAAATEPSGTSLPMPAPSAKATVEVFFSPGAETDRAIAGVIASARTRVWLAGYYFTSSPVAKALDQAKRRGVDVRVVLDQSQVGLKYSSATYFHNQRVPLWINARYPVMHHKFLVVDGGTVALGSMNFTRAGSQQNAENFNVFRRWPAMANLYAREFDRLLRESKPYAPGMTFDDRETAERRR
jgi:phosphatidylserine/phosphatidylglycerophosphate/cardiolipin synthase-like enzyme